MLVVPRVMELLRGQKADTNHGLVHIAIGGWLSWSRSRLGTLYRSQFPGWPRRTLIVYWSSLVGILVHGTPSPFMALIMVPMSCVVEPEETRESYMYICLNLRPSSDNCHIVSVPQWGRWEFLKNRFVFHSSDKKQAWEVHRSLGDRPAVCSPTVCRLVYFPPSLQ